MEIVFADSGRFPAGSNSLSLQAASPSPLYLENLCSTHLPPLLVGVPSVVGDTAKPRPPPHQGGSWLHGFAFCRQIVQLSDSYCSHLLYTVRFSRGMHLGDISAYPSCTLVKPSIPSGVGVPSLALFGAPSTHSSPLPSSSATSLLDRFWTCQPLGCLA